MPATASRCRSTIRRSGRAKCIAQACGACWRSHFRERLRDIDKTLSKDMTLAALKEDIVAAALERTFLAESLPMLQAEFARRVQDGLAAA